MEGATVAADFPVQACGFRIDVEMRGPGRSHAHPDAVSLASQHADLLARAAPGLLRGLYLVGSAALDDFQPGRSDVDGVAVTTRPVAPSDHAALHDVHRALEGATAYDAVYLEIGQVRSAPVPGAIVAHSLGGVLHLDRPCGEVTPAGWALLRQGVPVTGPTVSDLGVWDPTPVLLEATRANLRDYWRPLAAANRAAVAGRPPDAPAGAEVIGWLVLGAPRLHALLQTGRIVSKTAAGHHAAAAFPAWAALAASCVAWRGGQDVAFTVRDARAACDLVDAVVHEAEEG